MSLYFRNNWGAVFYETPHLLRSSILANSKLLELPTRCQLRVYFARYSFT